MRDSFVYSEKFENIKAAIGLQKQRGEIVKRYTDLLHDLGFSDIFVRPENCYSFNRIQYFEVNSLELSFWDETIGYRLRVCRGSGKDGDNRSISTEEFFSICDKLLGFIRPSTTLRRSDIKEQLVLYLAASEFEIIKVVSRFSSENDAYIRLNKEGFTFIFQFERMDIGQDVLDPFLDTPEEDKAVQEVFAGKTFYECHVGVVLTNQHFTKAAVELAKKNGILLWDRKKLIELVKKAATAEFEKN